MKLTKLGTILCSGIVLVATGCVSNKPVAQASTTQVYVPEEGGINFERITEDDDAVYSANLIKSGNGASGKQNWNKLSWWLNSSIAVSPNGKSIGYVNSKNGTRNIMVKSLERGGASTQYTFRTNISNFTWSPDGKSICFTEWRGGKYGIYLIDLEQPNVVRQISSGTGNDFNGSISRDGKKIMFHRGEGKGHYTLWEYDRDKNMFSNYSRGMSPIVDLNDPNIVYCSRFTQTGESEIWRINLLTGAEDIILGKNMQSYTTPQISPDGKWLLVTGTSLDEKENTLNTDIFAVRTDGTRLTQLTYHPGHDLSAIWSPDGRSIYFLSERGSAKGVFNVWKMNFNLKD